MYRNRVIVFVIGATDKYNACGPNEANHPNYAKLQSMSTKTRINIMFLLIVVAVPLPPASLLPPQGSELGGLESRFRSVLKRSTRPDVLVHAFSFSITDTV